MQRKKHMSIAGALVVIFGIVALFAVSANGASITATWEAPTNYVLNENCDEPGAVIEPEAVIEYTISYRIKDSGDDFANIESLDPSLNIEDLPWETTYEVNVGPHHPGKAVLCALPISMEITTPDAPSFGPCSNLVLTTQ
jgi:hypothetical protein